MQQLKWILMGASVATINIVPAANQVFKPERCTGSCGSCGFSCINSIAIISVVGISTLVFKKIKTKFKGNKI